MTRLRGATDGVTVDGSWKQVAKIGSENESFLLQKEIQRMFGSNLDIGNMQGPSDIAAQF